MNSKKCKQLRRMIYGDISQRIERSYFTVGHTATALVNGKTVKYIANQTLNNPESPRGKYLAAKRRYKATKRG
jgi:hypothetical protein